MAGEVKEALTKNEMATASILEAVNELRAADVAEQICRLMRRRAVEPDYEERLRIRRDINGEQKKYRAWTKEGASYDEKLCED